jgi:flagellin
MASILNISSASTALKTLQTIGQDLAQTRMALSSGKNAAGDARGGAFWAASKTINSDLTASQRVQESLALGEATVAVSRQAAETITDLLIDVKDLVIQSQLGNTDRNALQAGVEALSDQVRSVVEMSQLNGENLLSNGSQANGSGQVQMLSSYDRTNSSIAYSRISVKKQDLRTAQSEIAASGGSYRGHAGSTLINSNREGSIDLNSLSAEAGTAYGLTMFGLDPDFSTFDMFAYRTTNIWLQSQTELSNSEMSYVVRDGDTMHDVAKALANRWGVYAEANGLDRDVLNVSARNGAIEVTSKKTNNSDRILVTVSQLGADAGNRIGGGLEDLTKIDVTSDAGAQAAMGQIEGLINVAIDAGSALGTDQRRLESQRVFHANMAAVLKDGQSAIEATDLEESAARIQALLVQQELASQALSIANQSPQAILSLLR